MSQTLKSNLPLIFSILCLSVGGVWAFAQRDADLTHIQARQRESEQRIESRVHRVETQVNGMEGDVKVIRAITERIERKLP